MFTIRDDWQRVLERLTDAILLVVLFSSTIPLIAPGWGNSQSGFSRWVLSLPAPMDANVTGIACPYESAAVLEETELQGHSVSCSSWQDLR